MHLYAKEKADFIRSNYLKKNFILLTSTTNTMSITRDDLKDAVFLIRAKLVTADN